MSLDEIRRPPLSVVRVRTEPISSRLKFSGLRQCRRLPGTRDKGQRTRDKGQGTKDKGQRTREEEHEQQDSWLHDVRLLGDVVKVASCCAIVITVDSSFFPAFANLRFQPENMCCQTENMCCQTENVCCQTKNVSQTTPDAPKRPKSLPPTLPRLKRQKT